MATLFIEEYGSLPVTGGNVGQCAPQPALATQAVTFTGTHGASAAFNDKTRYVSISADAVFCRVFGLTPVALTTHPRRTAGFVEYFSVPEGQGFKVSAIATV